MSYNNGLQQKCEVKQQLICSGLRYKTDRVKVTARTKWVNVTSVWIRRSYTSKTKLGGPITHKLLHEQKNQQCGTFCRY